MSEEEKELENQARRNRWGEGRGLGGLQAPQILPKVDL